MTLDTILQIHCDSASILHRFMERFFYGAKYARVENVKGSLIDEAAQAVVYP